MNGGRAWALALKVLRTLRRDKRGSALMLVGPILQMMVIGFVFGATVSGIGTVVVDQDHGRNGAALVAALDAEVLELRESRSARAAEQAVRDGQAWAAIVVPPGFSASLADPNATATVRVLLDGSNAQVADAVVRDVQRALQSLAPPGAAAAAVVPERLYGAGAEPIDFFVAALMGFTVFNFTAITTLSAFVAERNSGMMARMQAAPVRPSEIVLGHALGYGVVAVLQGTLLVLTAVAFYDIEVQGSIGLALFIVVLLGVASQALGMLLSAAARRESQAMQMFPIVIVPAFIVSGTFVPVFSLPGWLEPLAYTVPLYWSAEALRSVLLRGWGLAELWPHLLALAGFATLFLAAAVAMLRRQRR